MGSHAMPAQNRAVFEEGVALALTKWTCLALAVENQWGGASSVEKANLLISDIVAWFYRRKEHFVDELAEELEDAISHDFNVQAEDGSPEQVAISLVDMFSQVKEGNLALVEKFRAMPTLAATKSQKQVIDYDGTVLDGDDDSSSGSGSDDGDDAMDADMVEGVPNAVPMAPAEPVGPVIDEDGFQMVSKGRKGRK